MRGDPNVIDPWLAVHDAEGKILAEDDDSAVFRMPSSAFLPPVTVITRLRTVFNDKLLGPFSVRIVKKQAPHWVRKALPPQQALGKRCQRPRDELAGPIFQLSAEKGKSYVFNHDEPGV